MDFIIFCLGFAFGYFLDRTLDLICDFLERKKNL